MSGFPGTFNNYTTAQAASSEDVETRCMAATSELLQCPSGKCRTSAATSTGNDTRVGRLFAQLCEQHQDIARTMIICLLHPPQGFTE